MDKSVRTCVRVSLVALGLGGLVLVLGNGLLVQLYIRDNVAAQLAGLEGPGLVALIPLSLQSLSTISSYFVYELIFLS